MSASQHPSLFRTQALAAHRRRLWGELLLTRPPGTGTFLLLLLATLLAAGWLLATAEFTRSERVHGYLVPDGGVLVVEAPQAGVVHALAVAEGDQLRPGQVLLEIRDPRGSVAGDGGLDAALKALAAEAQRLKALRAAEIERFARKTRRLEETTQRLQQRGRGLAAQETILATEGRLLARREQGLETLQARGYVASSQLEAAQTERLRWENRRQELRLAQLELAEQSARSDQARLDLPDQLAQRLAELDDRASRIQREREDISLQWRFTLRAPVAGRVAAVAVEEGDAVRPGRTLLTLLEPDARMQAVLLVPSRAAGFIEPGQAVRLRYAAFPQARFGSHPGAVIRVSHSILAPHQVTPPGRAEEPVYKVRVRPERDVVEAYGRTLPLQAGMALEADLALERRRLLHWLFDPLLALRGSW